MNLVRVRYDYDGTLSWLSGNSSVINGENSFLIRGMFKDANYRIIGTAYQGGTGQKYFQVASEHAVGGIGVTQSGNSSTGYKYSIKEVIVNHVDSLNFTIPDGTGSPTIDNLDTVTVADFNGSHAFLTGTGDSTTMTLKMLLTSTSTSNNSDMEKISDIAAYDTDEYFIGYQQSQQADHLYFAGRSGQIYSWLPDVTSSVVSSNFNGLAASHSTGWVPSLIDWYKVLWPVWTIDNGVAGANVTTNASIDARGSLHAKYIYHDLKTQGSGVLKHNLASGLPLVEMEQKGTLSAKFTFAANGTENYEMTALRSEPLPTSIKVYFSKTPYKGITEWQSHLDDMLPTQINNSGVYNKVNTIVNNGTPFTIKIQNLEAKDIVYMFWCDANDPDSMVCQGILKEVEDLVEVVDT